MNKREIQTIRQEAGRFSKDIKISINTDGIVRLELPFKNATSNFMHLYIVKRNGSKKFSLILPVESLEVFPSPDTLSRLQPLLKTYGLILTDTAVVIEESSLPLHKRISNMTQALIGIDGVCRMWRVEQERIKNAESKAQEPISNSPNNR